MISRFTNFLFVLALTAFFGCSQNKLRDPLLGLELGSSNNVWKNKVKILVEQKFLMDEIC